VWVLLATVPRAGWGYGFEKRSTKWKSGPVEFVVNTAHLPSTLPRNQYVETLRKALQPWQAIAEADLPFAIGPVVDDAGKTSAVSDGVNMIFWQPGFVPKDLFAGKAYPFAEECDILLAPRPPVTLIDIQAIVMHELGHCMGLAHSTAQGVMTKFTGLPALGHDDRVAAALRYPNSRQRLASATATLRGRVVFENGSPLMGAILRIRDGTTQRLILAGFSGLVDGQRRHDPSGRFELRGVPPGQHTLLIEPMDAFVAADPDGYGAPVTDPPASFPSRAVALPPLEAGAAHDLGTISVP